MFVYNFCVLWFCFFHRKERGFRLFSLHLSRDHPINRIVVKVISRDKVKLMEHELWVITGNDPVTWAIPHWVHSDDKRWATIWRTMALTKFQWAAMQARLGKLETVGSGKSRISMAQLRRIGHKVLHTGQVEDHFVWERRRLAVLTPTTRKRRTDRDEFLAGMFLRGIGRSEGELEYWLNQFCNHMIWWLINKETPVDLYFCKLHPSPYRLNWHRTKSARDRMASPILFAFDGAACLRSIEIEHTRTWWRISRRVEHDRVKMLSPKGYAAEYIAWAERISEQSTRLHNAWLAACSFPTPWPCARGVDGVAAFSDTKYANGNALSNRIVSSLGKIERESRRRKVASLRKVQIAKARHMRKVLHLQRRSQNLRNARAELQRPRNGEGGTAGVPVLLAHEGGPEESDMLAKGQIALRRLVR